MKWFRSNIELGSRTALFALAIQFVLSFGHFHGVAAEAAPATSRGASLAGQVAVSQSAQQRQPASDHDSDHHPDDICAICAVMAMANAVLFATPPLLALPQAIEFSYLTDDAEFARIYSARVAFQPRAPPIA